MLFDGDENDGGMGGGDTGMPETPSEGGDTGMPAAPSEGGDMGGGDTTQGGGM